MATSQRKLQALLDFTDTDLNANRKGRLSAAQVKELQRKSVYELKMLLGIPVILSVGILLMVNFLLALPVLVVMLAIAGGLVALHREHLKTFRDKQVRKLAGQLTKHPLKNGSIQYIISVGDERLPVDRELYEAISDGHFAVYILDDTHQILSLEPITKSAPAATKSTKTTVIKTTKMSLPLAAKPAAKSAKTTTTTTTSKATKSLAKASTTKPRTVVALPPKPKPATPVMKAAKPKGAVKQQQPPAAIGRSRSS
jgi:hypothetical protein